MIIPILTFIAILICSIAYQFYIAPLVDENEIPIDNKDKPIGSFINVKDITDELYSRSDDKPVEHFAKIVDGRAVTDKRSDDKPTGLFGDKPTGLFGGSSLVDNAWTCGCGQLNAEYRQECGKCKTMVK